MNSGQEVDCWSLALVACDGSSEHIFGILLVVLWVVDSLYQLLLGAMLVVGVK